MRRTLRAPIKSHLESPIDASSVARIRAAVAMRERRSHRWRRPAIVAGVAMVAAAVVALGVFAARDDARPQPLTIDGAPLSTLEARAERRVVFDDGSAILLGPGARVVPRINDGRELVLDLQRGRVELDVRPHGERRWMVDARWATVEVVGTRFEVALGRRRVRVAVQRGEVIVRGEHVPGRVRHLRAGRALVVEVQGEPVVTSEVSPAALPAAAVEGPPAPDEAPPTSELATEPRAPGRPEPTAPPADRVGELLRVADTARADGRAAEAASALSALLQHHASDPRAPMAAFSLARLRLDVLGQPEAGLEAINLALRLGLPPSIREDARARRVEALARSRHAEEARLAAEAFLIEYPESPRAASVRRWAHSP